MTDVQFTLFDTAIGRCGIAWATRGIVAVQLPQPDEKQTRVRLKQRYSAIAEALPPEPVQAAIDSIVELMKGKPVDLSAIDLDLTDVPEFNRNVYAIARQIPPGATLTYGDIAKKLGGVELSRNVGTAMGQNPSAGDRAMSSGAGCRRQARRVSANGGVETKLRMLAIEGAYVNHTPSLFD